MMPNRPIWTTAMPEALMQTLSEDKTELGKSAYSKLDAAEMATIRTGDFFMVTTDLIKNDDKSTISYALPAMARHSVNGLFMIPYTTSMCAPPEKGGAYAPVESVKVLPGTILRRVALPSLEETQSNQKIHLHYGARLETAIEECVDKMANGTSKADKAFAKLLKTSGEVRRSYLTKVVTKISNNMSFAQWEEVAPFDPATFTGAFGTMLKRDFLDKANEEATSGLSDTTLISATKSAIGQDPTNSKCVCLIMALLVGAEARAGPKLQATQVANPTPADADKAAGGDNHTDGGAADLASVKQEMKEMKAQLDLVIKMLQLRAATGGGPPTAAEEMWAAIKVKMIHDHNCGFYAAQVLADASRKPGCDVVVSKGQAAKARATVLRLARHMWRTEPVAFQNMFQMDFDEYKTQQLKAPNTANWFGYKEAVLFVTEYTNLEIRFIYKYGDGKVTTATTLKEGEAPREHVAFLMFTPGYIDIGMVQPAGVAKGALKLLFSHTEAKRAETLLIALAGADAEPNADPAVDLVADDTSTDAEFEKEMRDAMMGGKKASELPWESVSRRTKQERQAKAQAKLAEQKEKEAVLQRQALQQSQQSSMLTLQKQVQKQQEQLDAQLQLANTQTAAAKAANGKGAAKAAARAKAAAAAAATTAQAANSAAPASYAQALGAAAGGVPAAQVGADAGEFDHLLLGGSKVIPAMVVFTKEGADKTWEAVKAVAPAAGALIVSVQKAGTGRKGERVIFHTKETSVAAVQSAVQVLVARGMRAAVFLDPSKEKGPIARARPASPSGSPPAGLAGAAAHGLSDSILKSGVCRHYASQTACHFGSRCRFKCYKDIG